MRHLMSYASFDVICAYDINIWNPSIWLILVSKEASGPQQSHLWIRFGLKTSFEIQKLKNVLGIFSLYGFFTILCIFQYFSNKKWQPEYCSDFKDLGHFVSRIDHIMGKREKIIYLMTFGNYDTAYLHIPSQHVWTLSSSHLKRRAIYFEKWWKPTDSVDAEAVQRDHAPMGHRALDKWADLQ